MSTTSSSLHRAWLPATLLALAYVLVNFVMTKNSLSPIHQDDYLALGYGYEDMRWWISRPVSTNPTRTRSPRAREPVAGSVRSCGVSATGCHRGPG